MGTQSFGYFHSLIGWLSLDVLRASSDAIISTGRTSDLVLFLQSNTLGPKTEHTSAFWENGVWGFIALRLQHLGTATAFLDRLWPPRLFTT